MNLRVQQWLNLGTDEQNELLRRPAISQDMLVAKTVAQIIETVRKNGDDGIAHFTQQLDGINISDTRVSAEEIDQALASISPKLRNALNAAKNRIERFHAASKPKNILVNTAPGVHCAARYVAINNVGLYVPAGSAPLPSTTLMLAIPATLAGCKNIVMCSPPNQVGKVDDSILATASLCGVNQIYKIGGAQAIAAMAYGTNTVPKCDKLFGPGNRFVTEAKKQVSADVNGAAMDMPAGPSEVMVVVDDSANPTYAAIDLLAQCEHGEDSQAILISTCKTIARKIIDEITRLVPTLSRATTIEKALTHSRFIVCDQVSSALNIINRYAPEHLLIQTRNTHKWISHIQNAGSVFVGHYTPESLGDYCSGTNHVLPTYGFARSYQGLSCSDFMKRITFQRATAKGLKSIGPDAATIAACEGLDAHQQSVDIRLGELAK